jgi:hypothetical protein
LLISLFPVQACHSIPRPVFSPLSCSAVLVYCPILVSFPRLLYLLSLSIFGRFIVQSNAAFLYCC